MASFHQVFTTAYFPTVLMRTKDPKGDAALPQISLMVNRNLMPAIRLAGWLAVIASQVPGKTLKRPASIVGRKREVSRLPKHSDPRPQAQCREWNVGHSAFNAVL